MLADKNILYKLPIEAKENLRATSKYYYTNIDPTDPISLIIAILNSNPIEVPKFINRLKNLYPGFYNNIKNTKTYGPKNPSLFILRILIDDDIKTLPLQELEKVLQEKSSPIISITPENWEKLKRSINATYDVIKAANGHEQKYVSSQIVSKILKNLCFYSNLSGIKIMSHLYEDENEEYFSNTNFFKLLFCSPQNNQRNTLKKNFQGSNLIKAKFFRGSLSEFLLLLRNSNFQKTNLQLACFKHADLSGSDFQEANLQATIFESTMLNNIDFTRVKNLNSIKFKNCEFGNAKFINFENIDATQLKNQLAMLNTCIQQQEEDKDKKALTEAIFSDFKLKIEEVQNLFLKKSLLEAAHYPIFGFSKATSLAFCPDYFKSGEQKQIEDQLKAFNTNIKSEPR